MMMSTRLRNGMLMVTVAILAACDNRKDRPHEPVTTR